jgi:antirestriction protein ArdC
MAQAVERGACRRADYKAAALQRLPYQGINVLMLWGEAVAKGFAAPIWMTFKQAQEIGGHVRKGEHGSLVVYADRIRKTERDEATGEEAEREIPFLKGYTVFNMEQVEGLPQHFYGLAEPRLDPVQCTARGDEFLAATGADVRHGGDRAYYMMAEDRLQMPPFEAFRDAESYYATLAHELTHNADIGIMPAFCSGGPEAVASGSQVSA